MAHMLNTTAQGHSMAFVGKTPWHELGQQLTEGASLDVWTVQAGLNWQALSATPTFTRADGSTATYGDKQVIYRSDTGAPLSVMSDKYKIVQPAEVLDFFRMLLDGQDFKMETAGCLDGGRKMWALAKNGQAGEVVKGDKVQQYLLVATSLDGSTPTVSAFTEIRVVCANTLGYALRDTAATERRNKGKKDAKVQRVAVSHKSEFVADSVKAQLGLAGQTWEQFLRDARMLAEKDCSMEQARYIMRDIFGQPLTRNVAPTAAPTAAPAGDTLADLLRGTTFTPKNDIEREARDDLARMLSNNGTGSKEQKSVARCLALFAGEGKGARHEGVEGTMWGLLNAVTEYVDHEQGRMADTRMQSAWFGRGADFKQDTLAALLAA